MSFSELVKKENEELGKKIEEFDIKPDWQNKGKSFIQVTKPKTRFFFL